MDSFLIAFLIGAAFLTLYWVFYGQKKHNEMLSPKRKTELKAVIFDFDGVIADSFERQFIVFKELFKKFGKKELSKKEYTDKVWGNSVKKTCDKYFKNHSFEDITREYGKISKKHVKEVKIIGNAQEVLKKIKEKKYKTALVSNALRNRLVNDTKALKVNQYFDVMIAGNDVERQKPYPDPILKACEQLEVMHDEIIYVGDTKYDYKAAKSIGAFFVGMNIKGDLIISKIDDILKLL